MGEGVCGPAGGGAVGAVAVAVLGRAPDRSAPVARGNVTLTEAPLASGAQSKDSTQLVIEQAATDGLIDQATPLGSVSLRWTPLAVPVPVSFEFETVIVKDAVSPALIGELSAVFRTEMSGH